MCAWDVDLDVLHIVETDPTAPGGGNALLRSWIQVVGSGARLRRGQVPRQDMQRKVLIVFIVAGARNPQQNPPEKAFTNQHSLGW